MDNWIYFVITLGVIVVAVLCFFIIRFFKKLYYMIDEIDARLVQIRDLVEGGASKGGRRPDGAARSGARH